MCLKKGKSNKDQLSAIMSALCIIRGSAVARKGGLMTCDVVGDVVKNKKIV